MLARKSPRKSASGIAKSKFKKRNQHKRRLIPRGDTAQFQVNLKLFSPSKARRWDPRRAAPGSSPNYTLIMADESDMDKGEEEEFDEEDLVSDWEDYVDPYPHFKWLEKIHGEVTSQRNSRSRPKQIGSCEAYLIRRDRIADTLWDDMEELEDEMAALAFELFDRFGCLKPHFKDHPVNRGSGVWNDELDYGDLLLIEEIKVSPRVRRRGIGSKLARAILELTSKKSEEFLGSPGLKYLKVKWNAMPHRQGVNFRKTLSASGESWVSEELVHLADLVIRQIRITRATL